MESVFVTAVRGVSGYLCVAVGTFLIFYAFNTNENRHDYNYDRVLIGVSLLSALGTFCVAIGIRLWGMS